MVGGKGPRPAIGMIVGEAPTPDDEQAGQPFTGKAGKLLDNALASLGVPRECIYLTNVVKEVPYDDEGLVRRPTEEEIEAWRWLLDDEVQDVAPEAILALGETASRILTGFEGVPVASKIDNVHTAWHPEWVFKQPSHQHHLWLAQIKPWAESVKFEVAA